MLKNAKKSKSSTRLEVFVTSVEIVGCPLKTELSGFGREKKWNKRKNTYLDMVAWLFF